MPWCGIGSSDVDRLPDATPGFAVHVAYVRPPGAADRLAEWAPRIVGDIAAIDAWWRSQDPTRAPRFDLYPFACASPFGQLDISNVTLQQTAAGAGRRRVHDDPLPARPARVHPAREDLPRLLRRPGGAAGARFRGLRRRRHPDPAGCRGSRSSSSRPARRRRPRLRPIVAVHELVHTFGAVSGTAPHHCSDGHVCDVANDLLNASLSGAELETHVLDGGHDDYYGHSGTWTDVQDSLFLERLDSPDRAAPSAAVEPHRDRRRRTGDRSRLLASRPPTTSGRSPIASTRTTASSPRRRRPRRCSASPRATRARTRFGRPTPSGT